MDGRREQNVDGSDEAAAWISSAVAWDEQANFWIAVGTDGADISRDDGKTWASIDNGNWNAISLPWVVGPGGRIAKLTVR